MLILDSAAPGTPGTLVISASDVVAATACEYGLLRALDARLGRAPKLESEDGMLAMTAELGEAHERRVLRQFRDRFGDGVLEFPSKLDYSDPAALRQAHADTIAALRDGYDVVFQAAFFDGAFTGRADFLVRQADGSYAVYDTKLARHAKTSALLQLAAYAEQLEAEGIPVHPRAHLILGDGTVSSHSVAGILPVYRQHRDLLLNRLEAHRTGFAPAAWMDAQWGRCFSCPDCEEAMAQADDLMLVHRMTRTRRAQLHAEGITTLAELAALDPEEAASDPVLARLREQAAMQAGIDPGDGSIGGVDYRVLQEHTLAGLPAPSDGDIFFDFEGHPLWRDPADGSWGLEYLFGMVETGPDDGPQFSSFVAHDRAQERTALSGFLEYVAKRRQDYPDMHVYHYAAYEKSALRRLVQRHGVMEDVLDSILRDGVLVDLYQAVGDSLRISAPSYSIKKLEPLYMGDEHRDGVDNAADSVTEYDKYAQQTVEGRHEEAAEILQGILDYNEYDCVSTLRLRDWLLGLADRFPERARTAAATSKPPKQTVDAVPAPLRARLEAARAAGTLTGDEKALAMVAAAVDFYAREAKSGWWEHYDRLTSPVETWENARGTFVAETARILHPWSMASGGTGMERILELTGRLAPGSGLKENDTWLELYEAPFPHWAEPGARDSRVYSRRKTKIMTLEETPDGIHTLIVSQTAPDSTGCFEQLPMALVEEFRDMGKYLAPAVQRLAEKVSGALPELPKHAGLDLPRRVPPRLATLPELPAVTGGDFAAAITAAVRDLDDSYLAVQGPPGTGKTYTGSRVIARLVLEHGWKVGVVAQSHAAVENMLDAVLQAGVPASRVAKEPKDSGDVRPWTELKSTGYRRFLASSGGAVVGGTAWKFVSDKKFDEQELDLLVVDEAGQFSLAHTLAACRATRRLLLLGDPQQLPQVTQGTHPEPVDQSALGWLADGHFTLPAELGYFLDTSWRMHDQLCRAVSALSYEGRLHSAPAADERVLYEVEPGVECVPVEHTGNTVASPEEAEAVVKQVRTHLGLHWHEPDLNGGADRSRELGPQDILVVAPYNAQVELIARHLEDAGLAGVRVGTVDNFQGREAPVVIVSMTVSSPEDAPRGMDFVLQRNRVNVSVSRAQYKAVIIRSPELTRYTPNRPEQLEELGAFIALCGD